MELASVNIHSFLHSFVPSFVHSFIQYYLDLMYAAQLRCTCTFYYHVKKEVYTYCYCYENLGAPNLTGSQNICHLEESRIITKGMGGKADARV